MDLVMFFPIIILVGLMFFMSSRQRKQQKAQEDTRNELTMGDQVMTAGGMFGTVVDVEYAAGGSVPTSQDRVTLESAGSRSVWLRQAIAKKVDPIVPVESYDPDADAVKQLDELASDAPASDAGQAPAVESSVDEALDSITGAMTADEGTSTNPTTAS
ncbi:MAG: preprotein translocase subunit YajC [Cellulomonadaceae bacterium]|jgi:preprotein translocase subunit YajC|nr:preprotein translocase subunit YajC [Cellulomonadaceae bacterium]